MLPIITEEQSSLVFAEIFQDVHAWRKKMIHYIKTENPEINSAIIEAANNTELDPKAVALGADAVYVATAAVLALGCHLCRTCQTGKCNWGIATQRPELVKRLNPDIGSERLVNLMTAWKHEIKELMGGMGINSIESLRGNRLMLRGINLTEKELEILGISHAGE